ncbi:hypothetical protein D9M71_443190 [compost metagenome]
MLPAHQCLDAAALAAGEIDLGLIVVDQFADPDGVGQLLGVVAACFGCLWGTGAGRSLFQQLLQLRAGDRLEQGARHAQLMLSGQALGTLQDAFVLAADQHQGARIAKAYQMTDELDAIHLGHLQIAEDQVYATGIALQMFYRSKGPIEVGHLLAAEGLQLADQQPADEGVVVDYQNSHRDCLVVMPDRSFPEEIVRSARLWRPAGRGARRCHGPALCCRHPRWPVRVLRTAAPSARRPRLGTTT